MDKRLLVNREWNTNNFENLRDSWYTPRELLKSFKSVKMAEYTDTCSSAGDWGGYIVQKLNNISHVIPFRQENNYPRGGYTVYTTKTIFSFIGEVNRDEIEKVFCEIMY